MASAPVVLGHYCSSLHLLLRNQNCGTYLDSVAGSSVEAALEIGAETRLENVIDVHQAVAAAAPMERDYVRIGKYR